MFNLLRQKRFFPFFITMVFGALNDNLFKSALVILIAYNTPKDQADVLVQVAAGLFILPFFIFSGISGQLCDRYEKSNIIRGVKVFEVCIMLAAALGFYLGNNSFLLAMLCLMGVHSTLFGPVKYSILPQHLKSDELLAGNGLTSMGTFIAILLGTIIGGSLVTKEIIGQFSIYPISLAIVLAASLGFCMSLFIPRATPSDPALKICWNPLTETYRGMKHAFVNKHVKLAIFSISWFWFFGFFYMASLPSYCRDILNGNEAVATLLLTMISMGMGLGSILTNRLSGGTTRLGLVIIGGFGLFLFSFDLTTLKSVAGQGMPLMGLQDFWQGLYGARSALDFFFVGIFGGMYIVPLYTLMQEKAPLQLGSRVVASNNIWNAVFMVSAAIFAIVCFKFGLIITQIFMIVSITNLLITLFLLARIPEHFYHIFFTWLVKIGYRYSVTGYENLPKNGPVLIVSNHVSFIDPFIVCAAMNRPPRYMMDKAYFDIKILQWFFTTSKSIPVTPKKVDPKLMEEALDAVVAGLKQGDLMTIFPEGFLTNDGQMIPFKDGVERVAKKTDVDVWVVPVAIRGMWGSWFSRIKGRALQGLPPNRFRARVELIIGKPIRSELVSTQILYDEVLRLRGSYL